MEKKKKRPSATALWLVSALVVLLLLGVSFSVVRGLLKDDGEKRKFYGDRLKELKGHRRSVDRVLKNMDKIYAVAKRLL